MPSSSFLPPVSKDVTQATYCHLESRVSRSADLRVACAGREHCRADYSIIRRGYVCRGLELVVRGKGELKMGGRTFQLLPGHIFLYGPDIPHEIRCDAGAPMTKYFVDFFGGAARELFSQGAIRPGEVRRVPDPDSLARIFDALIEEGKNAGATRKRICAAYLEILLLKSAEAGSAEIHAQSQSLANLNRCRAYIADHAASVQSLQDLEDAMNLDQRYICRLFKRFQLPTPHQQLTTARLNRAAELLFASNEPVKSIAGKVGYGDALHFSRIFRRHFGCPPTEFRNQHSKHGNLGS